MSDLSHQHWAPMSVPAALHMREETPSLAPMPPLHAPPLWVQSHWGLRPEAPGLGALRIFPPLASGARENQTDPAAPARVTTSTPPTIPAGLSLDLPELAL